MKLLDDIGYFLIGVIVFALCASILLGLCYLVYQLILIVPLVGWLISLLLMCIFLLIMVDEAHELGKMVVDWWRRKRG